MSTELSLHVEQEEEVWFLIPGYWPYEASSLGRIRRDGKILKPAGGTRHNRYHQVTLYPTGDPTQVQHVHVLVLLAFQGPRPRGYQSRHLDGNRFNNRADNLRWGTREENLADARKHGSFTKNRKGA